MNIKVQVVSQNYKTFYFIIEGNNGATYILNTRNPNSVLQSLKFYKAYTIKQKVLKNALKIYLNALALLSKASALYILKTKSEIEQYLNGLIGQSINFELDENCSILVSPTRDKIIVHHHGHYFHKFAFGTSYKNVQNEARIYELLDIPLQNFEVSKFYDYVDNENSFCSFKLSSQRKSVQVDRDFILALVEMFNVTKQEKYLFSTYLESLKKRYIKSNIEENIIKVVFEKLESTHQNTLISLGLVHRDFKHWNVNNEYGLLIYDFEEAITDGLPLEDLLNYYIDPIVKYVSSAEIIEKIFLPENVKEYKRYLENLDIILSFQVFIYCYLIEKIVFYKEAENFDIRSKYIELLKQLNKRGLI
ncbi:MAG: hypothetical protein FP820_01305 [Sulfurimonas sp.]|nr:hypothetical protein [Sulfurimonas sp.]MBU3938882.1 aminoglycoside phosphotransferase family protein [bacterium]MBU4059844.1 aminoglycoside phosphotransferase family protein [bacterium]